MYYTWFKRLTILCVALLVSSVVSAQIVPNGSFENYVSIPTYYDGIANNLCTDWFRITNNNTTADYFHSSSPSQCIVSVPYNHMGFQNPAEGNAYAGLIAYREQYDAGKGQWVTGNWSEYLVARLNAPAAGTYLLSFKASLAEYASYRSEKGLGAIVLNSSQYTQLTQWFVTHPTSLVDLTQLNTLSSPYPQVAAVNFVDDATNWTTISGYVNIPTAADIYYVVIGAFNPIEQSKVEIIGTNCMNEVLPGSDNTTRPLYTESYYYIDDVNMVPAVTAQCSCHSTVHVDYQSSYEPCCWNLVADIGKEQVGKCGIFSAQIVLVNPLNNETISINPFTGIPGFVADVANNTWQSISSLPLPTGSFGLGKFCINNGVIGQTYTFRIYLKDFAGNVICTQELTEKCHYK
jgi:hypothetical protein